MSDFMERSLLDFQKHSIRKWIQTPSHDLIADLKFLKRKSRFLKSFVGLVTKETDTGIKLLQCEEGIGNARFLSEVRRFFQSEGYASIRFLGVSYDSTIGAGLVPFDLECPEAAFVLRIMYFGMEYFGTVFESQTSEQAELHRHMYFGIDRPEEQKFSSFKEYFMAMAGQYGTDALRKCMTLSRFWPLISEVNDDRRIPIVLGVDGLHLLHSGAFTKILRLIIVATVSNPVFAVLSDFFCVEELISLSGEVTGDKFVHVMDILR